MRCVMRVRIRLSGWALCGVLGLWGGVGYVLLLTMIWLELFLKWTFRFDVTGGSAEVAGSRIGGRCLRRSGHYAKSL